MSNNSPDVQLRKALEHRRAVNFRGTRNLKPLRLLNKVFGDGRQLVAFQPLNTGPNYYVIRVDSSWQLSDLDDGHVLLYDHIDEITNALEEQFGPAWWEGDPPAKSRDNGRPFRPTKEDRGCRWFALHWPPGFEPSTLVSILDIGGCQTGHL